MTPRPDRRAARAARVILTAILCLATSLGAVACDFDGAYDLPLPAGVDVGERPIEVTVEFADVISLVPKSEVRVDDVPVGVVTEVTRDGWRAEVTLALREDVRLPGNATADIRQTSLLGEKYVALLPPAAEPRGRLADGDHITLSRTGRNPEVEEVLGALSLLLNGGGVAQLQTISRELNLLMDGRQQEIGAFVSRLDTLLASVDRQRAQIFRALEGVDRLARSLNSERRTVTAALRTIGPGLRILADQRRALVTMLEGLARLGNVGTRVVTRTRDTTLASLRHLSPILTKLADAGRSLPHGLELLVSFPFPKEAIDVIKGDYANTAVQIDFDIAEMYGNLQRSGDLPPLPELPDPDVGTQLPLPRVLDRLRRACAHADDLLPAATDEVCEGTLRELRPGQLRRRAHRLCLVPSLPDTRAVTRLCGPRPSQPGGGLLDALPGGAVGLDGGLLSGGLG